MARSILVVDDEPGLRGVLKDLFEMEGFEVTVCGDPDSARDELAGKHFDLAMVDVYLSSAPTGLSVVKKILEEHPGTGVIVMTGFADRSDLESACISGAYTCIDKPFDLDDVLRVADMVSSGE